MSQVAKVSGGDVNRAAGSFSRVDYEDFLYHEAALLDEWKLEEWLGLFVEGATYEVPTTNRPSDVSSSQELFYISDNWFRLQHRVKRLLKESAHAESPRSSGLRMISNVRVLGLCDEGVKIECAFSTYRSKNNHTDVFFGRHHYVMVEHEGGIKIAQKRSLLAMSSLRPHGRVSIIV